MWTGLVSALIGLLGTGLGLWATYKQNKHLTGAQNEANQFTERMQQQSMSFNAAEAEKSRQWQQYMTEHKYQMETQSMQDAGLNPALVYGGGNLVSTAANGAAGSVGSPSSVAPNTNMITDLIPVLMQVARMPLEMAQLKAETEKTKAETENIGQSTAGLKLQNQITQGTMDAVIRYTNMAPDERRATIDKIVAETNTEDLRKQVLAVQVVTDQMNQDQQRRMNDLLYEYQQLQNAYQKFVNEHQEEEWTKRMGVLEAQICELYDAALAHATQADLNIANAGVAAAQEGLIKQEEQTESAKTALTNQQVKTESARTTHEQVLTSKDFNDPMSTITRSVVRPVQEIRDRLNRAWEPERKRIQKKEHKKKQRSVEKQMKAEGIVGAYATTGQAINEFGN